MEIILKIWFIVAIIGYIGFYFFLKKAGLLNSSKNETSGFYDSKSGKPLTESQMNQKFEEFNELLNEAVDEKMERKKNESNLDECPSCEKTIQKYDRICKHCGYMRWINKLG
jgi:hypothetical protein